MVSILGALLLSATIGCVLGLLANMTSAARELTPWASAAIGLAGAVFAGFILPQFGVPVSTTLSRGLATTILGAALPFLALGAFKIVSTRRGMHLTVFRFTYRVVAVLCFLDASLVMASLPLADRVGISEQAVIVSAIVAIAFVLVGLLVFRIAGQVSTVCLLRAPEIALPALTAQLRGLLTSLTLAGLMFGAILGLATLGLLSRIGEGFAVFG